MDKLRELLEAAIIGKAVSALIDDGYRVEMSDQDGGGLHVYAAPNGGDTTATGVRHWIKLVPGNGADVISDYSTNLEAVLKPVNAFAATWAD